MAKRLTLIIFGWLCVVLGVIGIFLPIMPTTPFILLAAWCFARSSERFHQWLLNNRFFGQMIKDWEAGKGIPRYVRNYAIAMLWVSMIGSMWLIGQWWSILILVPIGIGVSIYLWRLPLKQPSTQQN
jgi:uncharacterized membrane protein YbaN (DUF454 family)